MIVSGIVQGVGYRVFAASHARRLHLSGYVRNLPDGDVEVVAEGEEIVLQSFLTAIRQGPPAGRVMDVQVFRADAKGEYEGFTVRI
jgi:acylphosphatase